MDPKLSESERAAVTALIMDAIGNFSKTNTGKLSDVVKGMRASDRRELAPLISAARKLGG